MKTKKESEVIVNFSSFRTLILEVQSQLLDLISRSPASNLDLIYLKYFGPKGQATQIIQLIRSLPKQDKKLAGILINDFKESINQTINNKKGSVVDVENKSWFDISFPGILPLQGHLHIVTQAIAEITRIFERIGFSRVRHPEVDWDWYAFTSLNMPANHPARDEWETFHIEKFCHSRESGNLSLQTKKIPGQARNDEIMNKFSNIVLTPHTSNGQVREMEKGKLPIRMINIAKCYRRQIDVSHTPMFHQFEGLYIDKGVSIGHLKGVFDYFVKQFYGPNREVRLRPFHFQFTEPSFEVDINCALCLGKSVLPKGQKCKLCKSGWLEMAGAGMVHPVVLKNGGIDPHVYSGFAFGWGVERAYMMKNNTKIDDIRLIYSNDIRFLEQF